VMQRHWVPQLNPRADPYCSATGRGTETVRNQRPPSPRLKVRPGFPPGLPEFPAHPNHDLVSPPRRAPLLLGQPRLRQVVSDAGEAAAAVDDRVVLRGELRLDPRELRTTGG
jgi:hypothetical protein